ALDVPESDVDRRHGHRQDPAGAGATGSRDQFRCHGLDAQRVLADRQRAEFVDGMPQGVGQPAAKIRHAQPFDPLVGPDPQGDDRVGRIRVVRKPGERLVVRQCDDPGANGRDLHDASLNRLIVSSRKVRPRPGWSDRTSSVFSRAAVPSNNCSIQPMYSTVSPFRTAATRWAWISEITWLTTGRLKASAMPATFSHWVMPPT